MLKYHFSRISSLGSRWNYCFRMFTTEITAKDIEESVIVQEEAESAAQREHEIEMKRNKSRLSKAHFNIMHDRVPYEEPAHKIHYTVKYQRKLFAKYGFESNVNPSICWMDKNALEEKIEYDNLVEDVPIMETMNTIKEKRIQEKIAIQQREEHVVSQVAKIQQWRNELNMKKSKALAIATAAKEKKERLVEEVRRHFGYKVDPRDERFKDMLAEKEKQQKKAEKLAKKSTKEAKLILAMQQKNAEITSS